MVTMLLPCHQMIVKNPIINASCRDIAQLIFLRIYLGNLAGQLYFFLYLNASYNSCIFLVRYLILLDTVVGFL